MNQFTSAIYRQYKYFLLADTDRTTDVEDGSPPSDGEHVIFSKSSANCCSVAM